MDLFIINTQLVDYLNYLWIIKTFSSIVWTHFWRHAFNAVYLPNLFSSLSCIAWVWVFRIFFLSVKQNAFGSCTQKNRINHRPSSQRCESFIVQVNIYSKDVRTWIFFIIFFYILIKAHNISWNCVVYSQYELELLSPETSIPVNTGHGWRQALLMVLSGRYAV